MLIDNEDELPSELDVVEEQQQERLPETEQLSDVPNFYRDKSLEDVIKMHQEANKLIDRQGKDNRLRMCSVDSTIRQSHRRVLLLCQPGRYRTVYCAHFQ